MGKNSKNYVSERAATEILKLFFSKYPNSDKVSLNEIIAAAGREGQDETTNRNWINNKATHLRYHNLAKSDYKFEDNRKKLIGMRLTIAGKRALGRIEPESENEHRNPDTGNVTMNDVAKVVREFRNSNPDYEVVFDIKLKEVQPSK